MPTRQLYSVLTEPSRQTVKCTPGEYARVGDNTVSVTTSTLPRGVCSRDKYLNVSGFSMQSVFVYSSDQTAATASCLNLGVFSDHILLLPKFSGEMDSGKIELESFTDWKEI